MFEIKFLRCPNCSSLIKIDVGIVDVMGPPVVLCKHCEAKVDTNLREWNSLRGWGRIGYGSISVLAVIFGSYFIGASMYIMLIGRSFSDVAWQDPIFLMMYIGIGIITALLKILCVRLSIKRAQNSEELIQVSLTTWHMNFGLYYTLAFVVLLGLDYYFIVKPGLKP